MLYVFAAGPKYKYMTEADKAIMLDYFAAHIEKEVGPKKREVLSFLAAEPRITRGWKSVYDFINKRINVLKEKNK